MNGTLNTGEPGFEDFVMIARRHKDRGENEPAILNYNKALALQPGNFKIISELAELYFSTEDYVRAAEIYKKLLSSSPLDEKLHSKRITIAQKMNTLDELVREFSEIVKNTADLTAKTVFEKSLKQIRALMLFKQDSIGLRTVYEPNFAVKAIFDFCLLPTGMILLGMSIFGKRFKGLLIYSIVLLLFYAAYKAFILYQKKKA